MCFRKVFGFSFKTLANVTNVTRTINRRPKRDFIAFVWWHLPVNTIVVINCETNVQLPQFPSSSCTTRESFVRWQKLLAANRRRVGPEIMNSMRNNNYKMGIPFSCKPIKEEVAPCSVLKLILAHLVASEPRRFSFESDVLHNNCFSQIFFALFFAFVWCDMHRCTFGWRIVK